MTNFSMRRYIMHMIRKVSLCAIGLAMVACQNKDHIKQITVNLATDPTSLNPQEATLLPTLTVIRQLSEGLTRVNPSGIPEAALAEKIEELDEGRKWRFVLREAQWSDGQHVTTHDFYRSWKMMINKEVPAPFVEQLFIIKNARAIFNGSLPLSSLGVHIQNDREMVIELEEADPVFLYQISTPVYYPLPENFDPIAPYHVSCGPFILKKWLHEEKIILERNPTYWDSAAVSIPRIAFTIVNDPQTQLEMYEAGQLDWCGAPSLFIPEESEEYLDQEKRLKRAPEAKTFMLAFNTRQGPMSNLKLRLALAYSLNRQELIQHNIFNGQAAYSLVPPILMGESKRELFSEDFELAKQLWEQGCRELKVDPKSFPKLRFIHDNRNNYGRRAQAMQAQWRKNLGLEIQLESLEWKILTQRLLTGDFDIGSASWSADYPDPMNFLALYRQVDSGRNYPAWEDGRYKHFLEMAIRTPDIEEKKANYEQAEKILMSQMPITPIAHPSTPFMVKERLKNYYVAPMGYVDFKWAYIVD